MKKQMLSLLLAVVTAGCFTCKHSEPVKLSVFSGTVERVAKEKGVSLDQSAALLKDAGVSGFDTHYKDAKLPEFVKTGLKPINLYGWPKFLGPDGGAKDSAEFVAAAVKYGVPRIMVIPTISPRTATKRRITCGSSRGSGSSLRRRTPRG